MDEDSEHELEIAGKRARTEEKLPPSVARSVLFRLPKELRLRIYEYCLTAGDKARTQMEWPKPNNFVVDITPNLLRTCKIICKEATLFLYSKNAFSFHHPTDANIFVRCMSSPAHANLIGSLHLQIRHQDNRFWMPYLTSNDRKRSLRHDFPKLRELVIRYRSNKWNHNAPLATNMRNWPDDKHLDEIIDGLRHVYFDTYKDLDVSNLSEHQMDVVRTYEDADSEMQEQLRDVVVRERLREVRQKQAARLREHRALQIRFICMCRVHAAHFEALTAPAPAPPHPAAPVQEQRVEPTTNLRALGMRALQTLVLPLPSPPRPPVREGEEFFGFTGADLAGRAVTVSPGLSPGNPSVYSARTVFLNRKNIMLALEIFTYDST